MLLQVLRLQDSLSLQVLALANMEPIVKHGKTSNCKSDVFKTEPHG